MDPKLRAIAAELQVPPALVLGAWVAVLEQASGAPERGSITHMTPGLFAACTGLSARRALHRQMLAAFERHGLIKDGRVVEWERYQSKGGPTRKRGARAGAKAATNAHAVHEPLREFSSKNADTATTYDAGAGTGAGTGAATQPVEPQRFSRPIDKNRQE